MKLSQINSIIEQEVELFLEGKSKNVTINKSDIMLEMAVKSYLSELNENNSLEDISNVKNQIIEKVVDKIRETKKLGSKIKF